MPIPLRSLPFIHSTYTPTRTRTRKYTRTSSAFARRGPLERHWLRDANDATQFARDAVTQRDRAPLLLLNMAPQRAGDTATILSPQPGSACHSVRRLTDLMRISGGCRMRRARRGFSTADSSAACPDPVNDQPPETPKHGWAFIRTPLARFRQQRI